jgi:hypothetical protein
MDSRPTTFVVEAGARDVLAHLVDYEDVDVVERQLRHHGLNAAQHRRFGGPHCRSRHDLYLSGITEAVLGDTDAEQQRPGSGDAVDDRLDGLSVAITEEAAVVHGGPELLAHADGHHLHQP